MIKNFNHVAIAVKDLDETLRVFENLFGLKPSKIEDVPDQGVKAALIPIGSGEIELLEPIDPNGGVAKFLERRGEGIHHICLDVDDTDAVLKSLAEKGVELIDKVGRKGLAGKVGFIHPKSTKGVLIEIAHYFEPLGCRFHAVLLQDFHVSFQPKHLPRRLQYCNHFNLILNTI